MRKRGCERFRQAPVLRQKDARMGMAVDGLCHPAQAFRGTNGVRSPSCHSSVFLYQAQGK